MPHEVNVRYIESRALLGKGIGTVDVHLLASVALTEGARLWTRDKKLRLVAQMTGCAYQASAHRGFSQAHITLTCRAAR